MKPYIPKINWNNRFSQGLVFDVPLFEGGGTNVQDVVSNRNLTTSGTPLWKPSQLGPGLSFDGSTQFASVGSVPTSNTTNYALAAIFSLTTIQAAGEKVILYVGSDANSNGVALEVNAGVVKVLFRGQNLFDVAVTLTAGVIYNILVSNRAVLTTTVYINGLPTATTSSSSTNAPTANTSLAQDNSNAKRCNCTIYSARVWANRSFNAQEAKQLYTDPWQIYTRPNKFPSYGAMAVNALRMMMGMGM